MVNGNEQYVVDYVNNMKVVYGKAPPNYADIIAALPQAKAPGVFFTYGDTVYVPDGVSVLTPPLRAHEKVHVRQQAAYHQPPAAWWIRYLDDPMFRFEQELEAHQAEYAWWRVHRPNHREPALFAIASRLASDLYGCGITGEDATRRIVEQWRDAVTIGKGFEN